MDDDRDISRRLEGELDDRTGRLAAYEARTQTPLDVFALMTLWIVIVPPRDFGSPATAIAVRIGLSLLYAADISIRAWLAPHPWRYLRGHWPSLVVVVLPPLRVAFSIRLVRSMFRRGHLQLFLLTAMLLVLNAAAAVYFYERHAAGSNIHTLAESIWWSLVTVATVGYGDYYPVTGLGRIAAVGIMAIGILTLAVVTAQVASSFVEQASRRKTSTGAPQPPKDEVTLADLAERLARIEGLLSAGPAADPHPPRR